MSKFFRTFPHFSFLWPILFVILGTVSVILYGRGYRPDFSNNQLKPTGLLSATSDPVGAQVYINNQLKTATNNPVNLDPNWYTVKIVKEGYISWEKNLRVQGEVVTQANAFLFPTNPSLSPLTNTGIENPLLSPDGAKIAYTIPLSQSDAAKAGLWVYELADRPLGLNRDPKRVGISGINFNFSQKTLLWSPDSTEILVDFGETVRLYQVDRTDDFQDVTNTYKTLLTQWNQEQQAKEKQKLSALPQKLVDIATSSAKIIAFSPDETKFLYEATSSAVLPPINQNPLIGTNSTTEQRNLEIGKLYVYDIKEDKNFFVLDKKELPQPASMTNSKLQGSNSKQNSQPKADRPLDEKKIGNSKFEIENSGVLPPIHWFPTNRHLVLTLPGKIDIMEYDRTNWVTVYAGPFIDGFIAPWPNGSRIIIMTNLNPGVSSFPNLYTVNLR